MGAPTPSTNGGFNDGAISYGCRLEDLRRPTTLGVKGSQVVSNTDLGNYIFENITLNRPVKEILRPDEIGGPNGFVQVNDYVTGSFTLQYGGGTTNIVWPRNGDWFSDTFDAQVGAEYFELHSVSYPFEMNGYFKITGSLRKISFPASD